MNVLQSPADLAAVTTTVSSAEQARGLAQAIMCQGLAACVQVEAVVSHYRWEGALREEGEHRLVCKTLPAAVPALLGLLRAQHPYDLPELVVQPLRATAEYADWVRQEVQAA
jgi:periplasmic divalent cation tolerance protein